MEKIKNLPVMRFVAFAVALAILLGVLSVMLSFTASADTVTNGNALDLSVHQIGALGKYPVIGLPTSQLLADYIATSDPNSTKSIVDYFVPFTVYNGVTYYSSSLVYIIYHQSYFSNLPVCNVNLGGQTVGSLCDSVKTGSDTPTNPTDYRYVNFSSSGNVVSKKFTTYPNDVWKVTYDFKSSNGVVLSSSNVSSIMYARVKTSPSNVTVDTNSSSYINASDSFSDMESLNLPKAEFITCASFEPDDNTTIPLWFKDFTSEGQQYPLFTYYVHDNGNKHSYSLKLSYSESAKEDVKKVFNLRENTPADSDSATKDLIERIVAMYALHGVKIHDLTPYLRTSLNIKFPNNLIYNQTFVLSSPEMDFSTIGDNKVYTICLSDYSDILQCLIYKAEIIDNNTGLVLDTTYFTSKQTFNKGNSGYGSKVYDYGDNYNGMIDDIKNNTPSVEPSNKDSFISDGDIINTSKYDYYSGIKIDDIFGSLQSSASSLGSFFQACMNIIPAGILAVIIGGLSIVIVLRILGR